MPSTARRQASALETPVVRQHRLRNLIADAHDWVQRSHRLLKNHGDARAAKLTQLIGRQTGEARGRAVPVLKDDFTRDGCASAAGP